MMRSHPGKYSGPFDRPGYAAVAATMQRNLVFPAAQFVEQNLPCAGDAALDRANSTTADASRLVVRHAGYSNQEECFSLAGRQLFKGAGNVLELDVVKLRRRAGELGGMVSVAVGHFANAGNAAPQCRCCAGL